MFIVYDIKLFAWMQMGHMLFLGRWKGW